MDSNNIREARKRLHMTQKELAAKVQINHSIISKMETGKECIINSRTMNSIANALNSTVEELFL